MKYAPVVFLPSTQLVGPVAALSEAASDSRVRMKGRPWISLFGLAALLALNGGVRADEFGREHREEAREHHESLRERHEFRERDVHRFDSEELGHWRGGYWRNSCFGGRCGWWWFAGGQWFFYERPIHPYPLVVSEIAFLGTSPAYVPSVNVPPPAPAPQPAQTLYFYCDNPPGYYPSVPVCATGFREVPALPR